MLGRPWTGDSRPISREIPAALWDRNQLSIDEQGPNPHLLPRSQAALLFFVLAFVLLNLWVYLLWAVLAVPRRGGRWLDHRLFRLARFIDFLRDAIRDVRKPVREVSRPVCVF